MRIFFSFPDFNECIPLLRTCDVNALCRNTLGSYECICKRGFIHGPDDDKTCIGMYCVYTQNIIIWWPSCFGNAKPPNPW